MVLQRILRELSQRFRAMCESRMRWARGAAALAGV